MFPTTRCSYPDCRSPAVWDRSACAVHDPDPVLVARQVAERLRAEPESRGLSLAGLTFGDVELRERRLEFVSFSRCRFERVSFSGSRLRYVYFDFAAFDACDFSRADIGMCVFAGAEIRDCAFTGCELIQCNFLGATCDGVRFDDSDLYSTRFVAARFRDVTMRDCNLKEVHFDKPPGATQDLPSVETAALLGLDVTSSNAEEAVYGGER